MKTSAADAPEAGPLALPEAAAAWAGTHRVSVGRWWVRYREAGRGPAVVLVHGLGISADYWHRNAPALAAGGFRVLAPDLPGFGRTAGPPGGLSVGEQAALLAHWCDAVQVESAAFVGHSLSCQTVLELAAVQPERVWGLLLAAPTGDGGGTRMLTQAWGLVRDAWIEPWKLLVLATQSYLRAGPRRVWRTWWMGAHHQPLALLPRIRAPGLVVVGTRDPVVRPTFAQALAAGLPNGRVEWVEGGSHAVLFSRPEAFNAVALRFFEEARGTGNRE